MELNYDTAVGHSLYWLYCYCAICIHDYFHICIRSMECEINEWMNEWMNEKEKHFSWVCNTMTNHVSLKISLSFQKFDLQFIYQISCLHVFTFTDLCTWMWKKWWVSLSVCVCVCVCMYVLCVYVFIYVCVFVYVCMCVCVHVNIYTHTYYDREGVGEVCWYFSM